MDLNRFSRTLKTFCSYFRPQRKLRARKKSGEELLVDTLRDALRKCEGIQLKRY